MRQRQLKALAFDRGGLLLAVLSLDVVDGCVQTVRSVVDPDKLGISGPSHHSAVPRPGRRR